MGAWGVSMVTALLLAVALSPARPEPEPAQSPIKAGATKNSKNPYCSVACRSGQPHTLCQYSSGPASSCKDGRSWPLSSNERSAILHAHNLLRNKMASGGVPPFPSAANMRQMEWDSELEQIAQRWADQCSFSHDQCRDSGRFTVGQNVAIYFSSAAKFPPIESRVHSWYDEIKDYTYAEGPFSFSFATGHFTQVVWGDTFLVGCGRARYEENSFPTQLLVCNYGPGGNVETEPLYRKGSPCAGCPAGTACSPTYPALCAGQIQEPEPREALPPSFTFPSSVAPLSAVGLRSFFASPTENSIVPVSFGPSTFKPFTTAKPFFTTTRPVYTTAKPVYTTAKPVFTTAKPVFTTAKPVFTTAKPVFTTAKPVFTTAKPVYTTTRPVFTTTKPVKSAPTTARPFTTARPVTKAPPRTSTGRSVTAGRALSTTSKPFSSSATTRRPTIKPTTTVGLSGRSFASTTPTPVAEVDDEPAGCPISKSVGPTCKEYRAAPLSPKERETVLDFHNARRSGIAAGELPGFKPASDMKQMYWDEELESLAQAWADKCQWGHDPCRRTERWSVKGQNLGLTFSLDWSFPPSTDRVDDWYQELKLYNYSSGPFIFSPDTSHFTQLAWADSYLVGCGRTRYMSEHGLPSEYLVCNYGPGGNIFGNPLYREGAPCSRCPLSCSDRYPGLCTRPEDSNELAQGTAGALVDVLKLDEPSSPPFLEGQKPAVVPQVAALTCPRPPGPGPNCIGHQAVPLTQLEKIAILHRHNFYRSQVAAGVVSGLPAASSMLQMVWDDEVASLAQRWADQCSFGYDECAKTDAFRLGQSMAIWYSKDSKLFPAPEGRVEGWFNERHQANLSALVDTFKFSPTTAAFSQLAWADTWLLGCGRSRYSSVELITEILVCNYGPGGNVQGGRMYTPGTACTGCPAACSTSYPGLCATTAT